jgi:hypothetical protein
MVITSSCDRYIDRYDKYACFYGDSNSLTLILYASMVMIGCTGTLVNIISKVLNFKMLVCYGDFLMLRVVYGGPNILKF